MCEDGAVSFHVFVEGAVDGSPDGIRKLCEAMAQRYGLRSADLIGRMSKGRFRVKGNIDRAIAEQFAYELAALGARCTIEDAAVPARPPAKYQSGLAAAFVPEAPAANLGALEQGAGLALVGVDGGDEQPAPTPVAFASPPQDRPAAKPKDVPVDLFAPADAGDGEFKLELAAEDVPKKKAPPPAVEEPAAPRLHPVPGAVEAAPAVTPLPRKSKLGPLALPRVRFAVGVALALVLGFVPAHVIASARERSTYASIDRELETMQQAVDTPEAYESLDRVRATQLERKTDARRNIALLAFVIWAAAGGGIAYGWFRRVPWDRL